MPPPILAREDFQAIKVFCAGTSKTAPSPALEKGEIYCRSSFLGRADQWYREEVERQVTARYYDACAGQVGGRATRRQPRRAAKEKVHEGDYTLPEHVVDLFLVAQAATVVTPTLYSPQDPEDGTDQTPKVCRDQIADTATREANMLAAAHLFREGLMSTIHDRARQLRALHKQEGIRHICTVADKTWDCLDEEYCGHGLVEKSTRWVPKKLSWLTPRIKAEMEAFFSSDAGNNYPDRLRELKRHRCAGLKEVTLQKVGQMEQDWLNNPQAMAEAEMLESPTLGRWPTRGFVPENLSLQRVQFAGLTFAVDVCQGELHILML